MPTWHQNCVTLTLSLNSDHLIVRRSAFSNIPGWKENPNLENVVKYSQKTKTKY